MSPFVWQTTPEQAFVSTYEEWVRRVELAVEALCQRYAAEIEAWMKAEAIWTDRTSNLRQSLYAEVETFATEIVLGFDYGLDYGYWLEFANQGRFAIIAPALDYFYPRFFADLQRLVA
jgi:hypothetical protein